MTLREAIAHAREVAKQDPELAAFIVRDYEELKQWSDLHTLAWLMSHEGTCFNEVVWLLDSIEAKITEGNNNES